jgi:mono/diheme cytochrome c family protein
MRPLILSLSLLLALAGRSTAQDSEDAKFFESRVRPLLLESCGKCHGAEKHRGGLRLDSRAGLLRGGDNGPAILPGKPDESLLIKAVRYEGPEMPPKKRLKPDDVVALVRWVRTGAVWPGSENVRPAPPAGEGLRVSDDDRRFWAFRPLQRPPVPTVRNRALVRNPIDAFVLRRLEEKGLDPSGLASPRELCRRITFDLHGLPPTPEEVTAFVTDARPDAAERLVDRLLASPRYGERWGRHWLDLVRFAQTNGYEEDDEKPLSWRYRDYVIRAFNEDKPYDRFVHEQLAGDELEDRTPDSILATGFYRLGVWDDEPDDKLAATYEELDDIIRTTSETFLGLTVGCARCHEHKFDPIPQQDYYRLLAFFRNVAPYGRDLIDTHWEPNPDAILTPIGAPDEEARWRAWDAEARSRIKKLKKQKGTESEVTKLQQALLQPPFDLALSVRELNPEPAPTHVLIRGNPRSPGAEVRPGVLSVLIRSDEVGVPALEDPPPPHGRRLKLARWITGSTNPLTARVIANRLWHYHFGRGIVATPSDFGHTGSPPSDPELLDWLASELVEGGWSLKRMQRLILGSAAYQRSSRAADARAAAADPENVLLWRQNLRRLEAEAIRDSVLAVSGRLNLSMGGRGFFPELAPEVLASQSRPGYGWGTSSEAERSRRSVYAFVKRTLGVPLLETLDMPVPDKPAPARVTTTVAPQALTLLNSAFVDQQARAFAARLLQDAGRDPSAQVERAYLLALGRLPIERERRLGSDFVARQSLAAFCTLMFNLNEFVYVD